MLAFEHEFEGMLIAMHQRRLLDSGEYFLIGVDSKPYDPSHPRIYAQGLNHGRFNAKIFAGWPLPFPPFPSPHFPSSSLPLSFPSFPSPASSPALLSNTGRDLGSAVSGVWAEP